MFTKSRLIFQTSVSNKCAHKDIQVLSALTFFFICIFLISGDAQSQTVEQYLAAQKTIRMLVVQAPGYGHQMTVVAWARRLRELGFRGQLELIVEPYVVGKLQHLIPEIMGSKQVNQPFPHLVVTTLQMSIVEKSVLLQALRSGEAPFVDLAIVPAEDYYQAGGFPGQLAAGRPTPMKDLGVFNILRMQPQSWLDGKRSMERSDGNVQSLQGLSPLLMIVPKSTFPRSQNLSDLSEWLKDIMPTASELERSRLAAMLSDQNYERLPFYCAHNEQVVFLRRIARVAARMHKEKPIRIWVASEISDFQWSNVARLLKPMIDVTTSVRMIDLNGSSADVVFGANNSPGVEIIRLAHRPPALFEELVKTATLPPAVTGKYSQNMMMQNGVPFLELKYFIEVQNNLGLTGEVYEAAKLASREIGYEPESAESVESAESIIKFWNMFKFPAAISQFSSQKIRNTDHDLVYQSLKSMAKFSSCDSLMRTVPPKPIP